MKKILILTGFVFLFAGCKERQTEQTVVRSVKADTVKVYGESGSAVFPGKIVAASDMSLAFRVSGPILRVNAEVGAYVRKGQVLAQIDPRDYEVQLAATTAEYEQVRGEVQRITELYEKGTVTPNDYDKARYGFQQISAKYDAHKNALADTKLLAPCDGYVQKRFFEAGETVGAGTPVVSMIGTGTGEVEINIPSSDYIRREQFDNYYCTVDIYPGKTFPLELIGITRKANMNQLYTMRFRLTGDDRSLPGPGMSTLVTIRYKTEDSGTVSVPLAAVFQADDQTKVWVYDPSGETVSARTVKLTEILLDGTAVVSAGLSPGQIVLSGGVHSVKEGEKVKLLPAVSPTNVGGLL